MLINFMKWTYVVKYNRTGFIYVNVFWESEYK